MTLFLTLDDILGPFLMWKVAGEGKWITDNDNVVDMLFD